MIITRELLDEVALTQEEYDLVVSKLGREPNMVELGMFGAMWSEHCGYKNSKPVLRLFPTKGPRVLQGPGENAGAVDIGDGIALVMKVESHNHPSAVEPYQGAATGVGGIVRDIFTMGARPIALLDSLRFGPLTERHNSYLTSGVVAGIAGYGNCIGVPTVGGEIYFEDSYSGNPLVNAMCVGLARSDGLMLATASGPGNPVILVGADTGRDGIHGATFASVELNEKSEERRPAVQVGNPFLEKLPDRGVPGAAGDRLRRRHAGPGRRGADQLRRGDGGSRRFRHRHRPPEGLPPRGGDDAIRADALRVAGADAGGCPRRLRGKGAGALRPLGPPLRPHRRRHRRRHGSRPGGRAGGGGDTGDAPHGRDSGVLPGGRAAVLAGPVQSFPVTSLQIKDDYSQTLLELLAAPNLCSRRAVFQQYDHMVQVNTVVLPEQADAAVLRVKGTDKAIALTIDGNGRYCYLEPRWGGAIAVAEAARNLVCSGAEPLAVTDCLNYGNPEKPEVFYTLRELVDGNGRRLRGAGRAGHQRQRQPVQREQRLAHIPDPRRRDGGSDRADRARHPPRLPRGRRCGRAAR